MKELKQLLSNAGWIIKLNITHIPFITAMRLIGALNQHFGSLVYSFSLGIVIDMTTKYLANNTHKDYILYGLLIFGGCYLFNTIGTVAQNYGNNTASFKTNYDIPETFLQQKLNNLSISSIENPQVQNMITRYRENRHIVGYLSRNVLVVVAAFISLLIATIPLLTILPWTTLLLILSSIPALISNNHSIKKLWKLDQDITVINRKGGSIAGMLGNPNTMKEIKLLNGYSFLKKYYDEYVSTYFTRLLSIYKKWALFDLLNGILIACITVFGIYQLILLAESRMITLGQIAFFIAAITSIGHSMDMLSSYVASFAGDSRRLSEMRSLLDYPEDEQKDKVEIEKYTTPPMVSLDNVSFKYPSSEKYIIENLNLEIKPGEKIAIVGENGAGKTTLVKLISNIYPVTQGHILVNNQNLKDITTDSWFKNIGVLYQDYNTYGDLSAAENIALGNTEIAPDQSQIIDAATKADAADFIQSYPDQYNQILSEKYEGGIRPSTGQWQKIAIARFFYRNAPILILDEPTASIDAIAEANIFDRIYSFIQNKTVIIISHRFSTVRNADRIIVFDQGKIVEQGTHAELLKLNGKYAHAFNIQAKGYQ